MNQKTYKIREYTDKEVTPQEFLDWSLRQSGMYRRLAAEERQSMDRILAKKTKKSKEYDAKADQLIEKAKEVAKNNKLRFPR